nr:DUF6516 family protein [Duganella aceris]
MKATLIHKRRFSTRRLRLQNPLFGGCLAYVVNGRCVLRYDNEAGKDDHRHYGRLEPPYNYRSIQQLMADFEADIKRWNNENGDL